MLITNAKLVGEGRVVESDLRVVGERIERIDPRIAALAGEEVIDARGRLLLPGLIDDQVHFREPGLTHKGDLETESSAAVAGGVTSVMEMPNVDPATVTRERLAEKYQRAAGRARANYAFYLGATNDNLDEIRALKVGEGCGVKIFMGSSTGNLLVDDPAALEKIFEYAPCVVATHCEDNATIRANEDWWLARYGEAIPIQAHPLIRSAEACYRSSALAVSLARRFGTRLHILHLTTEQELSLLDPPGPLAEKRITAEACVHHLFFDDSAYAELGTHIKCNPAIKSAADREALLAAVRDGRIDIIATDHAPHTLEEKARPYRQAPSGLPLVQHSLLILLELVARSDLDLPTLVARACHAPALRFGVADRGFLREGYYADLVLVDPAATTEVDASRVYYKCAWTPFPGRTFRGRIDRTWVNGVLACADGVVQPQIAGQRLGFQAR